MERIASLRRLEAVVRGHRVEFEEAISRDFGNRAQAETVLAEVMPVLSAIRHARRHLAGWMRPQRRRVGGAFRPGRAWVEYQPLGVVGIVAPWNYPLLLALSPLVDALAAGNRAMIKPSELAPRFAEALQRAIAEAFSVERVAVVTGGAEVAQAFCALPVDHLLFTGSARVGRAVMAAAAANLTPVTLELGGKSPVIVCGDCDIAAAARSVAIGKFFNAGQTCLAPDYALVPQARAAEFADAVAATARALYPSLAGNPDYTVIIDARHFARLQAAVAEAAAGGATLLRHPEADAQGRIAPVVVLEAPAGCALLREEIFGPVLPVIGYRDLDAALAHVAAGPTPLALYCYTRDRATARRVLAGTRSGGVTLNGTLLHCAQDDLPFGGLGASGFGAYHGREGFLRLSHARGVYRPGRFSGFAFLVPPHGRLTRLALRLMLRG